jgi:hypothetical protein
VVRDISYSDKSVSSLVNTGPSTNSPVSKLGAGRLKEYLPVDQEIIVFEEQPFDENGDRCRRARISSSQWVTLVGVQSAELFHFVTTPNPEIPRDAMCQFDGDGSFEQVTMSYNSPLLVVERANGDSLQIGLSQGTIGDPKAPREGHNFCLSLNCKDAVSVNITDTKGKTKAKKTKKFVLSFGGVDDKRSFLAQALDACQFTWVFEEQKWAQRGTKLKELKKDLKDKGIKGAVGDVLGDGQEDEPECEDGWGQTTWITVQEARVRSSAVLSSPEMELIKPGETVQVLERTTVNGHQRARIGDGKWISLVTSKGSHLCQQVGPDGEVLEAASTAWGPLPVPVGPANDPIDPEAYGAYCTPRTLIVPEVWQCLATKEIESAKVCLGPSLHSSQTMENDKARNWGVLAHSGGWGVSQPTQLVVFGASHGAS